MHIIYNKTIPFGKSFYAINLFGILFAKGPCDAVTINHESIHTAQIREWAFVPFYLIYIIEWLWRWIQYRDWITAYYNISFEREAYANQTDLSYLKKRRHYASRKYLKRPTT
jgi:hypothetical protein